jgi:tRNA pseudouridine55 synthase
MITCTLSPYHSHSACQENVNTCGDNSECAVVWPYMDTEQPLPEGVLLIDKPVGITSFDVIRTLRKVRQVKKMGHAGTLDPLASGLMIVAEGPATKLLTEYQKLPKRYMAEICLGESTDTGDREGVVTATAEVEVPEDDIRKQVASMVGVLELAVPAYSAIKQGGEALYKKARRGEEVDVPVKAMHVHEATLVAAHTEGSHTIVSVDFYVGSGTYIRSLAVELGNRLGVPARLENLRRTSVGPFTIEQASPLPRL